MSLNTLTVKCPDAVFLIIDWYQNTFGVSHFSHFDLLNVSSPMYIHSKSTTVVCRPPKKEIWLNIHERGQINKT